MNSLNITTVCRLCLVDTGQLSVLDNTHLYLQQKILACLSIEIKDEDHISKMICKHCLTKVEEWYDYRRSCQKSQFLLMHLLNSDTQPNVTVTAIKEEPCNNAEEDINYANVTVKQEPSDDTPLPLEFIEPENPAYETQLRPVSEETLAMIEEDDLLVPSSECPSTSHGIEVPAEFCQICGKNFSSYGNRVRHERNVHQLEDCDEESETEIPQENTTKKIDHHGVKCYYCNKRFATSSSRIRHEKTVHDQLRTTLTKRRNSVSTNNISTKRPGSSLDIDKFPSGKVIEKRFIDKRFITKPFKIFSESDFFDFYNEVGKSVDTTVCVCCDNYFRKRKTFITHIKKLFFHDYHYNCWKCFVSFPNRVQYKTHTLNLKICENRFNAIVNGTLKIKPYLNLMCTLCEFILVNDTEYKLHFNKHKPVEFPKICQRCNEIFDNLETFKEHYFSDCVKRFYCGICKYSFDTENNFNNHCSSHQVDNEITFKEKITSLITLRDDNFDNQSFDNLSFDNQSLSNQSLVNLPLTNNPLNFCCRLCSKEFESKTLMFKHLKINHKDASIDICQYCPDKDLNKYVLKDEFNQHLKAFHENISTNNFSCNICGSLFATKNDWREHQKLHEHKCHECNEIFDTKDSLNAHKSKHVNHLKLKIIRCSDSNSYMTSSAPHRPRRNSVSNQYTCHNCDEYFTSKEDLRNHLLTHEDYNYLKRDFDCKKCDRKFDDKHNLKQHNREYHEDNPRFIRAKSQPPERETESAVQVRKCPLCDFVAKASSSLFFHNKRYHSKQKKIKPLLNLSDSVYSDNKIPNKIEVNGSASQESSVPFLRKCLHCNFYAKGSSSLYHHLKKYHYEESNLSEDTKETTCKYCNIVCKNVSGLASHIKIHTENRMNEQTIKTFNCVECHLPFKNKELLQEHIFTHIPKSKLQTDNKKLHPCIYCNKLCVSYTGLVNHMRFHDKSGYKCCCGKILSTKKSWSLHVRKYCNETSKVFNCRICSKPFGKKRSLQAHMRYHKNEERPSIVKKRKIKKIFNCEKCKIRLPNSEALDTHVKMHIKADKHKKALNDINQALNSDKNSPTSSNNKELKCQLCNEIFDNIKSFGAHRGWHKRQIAQQYHGNLKCKLCKMMFAKNDDYKKHILTHKNTNVYNCFHCPNKFVVLGRLIVHLRKYHGVECDRNTIIGQKLVKKVGIKKNFSCIICNITFPSAKRLKIHMDKHIEVTET